MPYQLNLHPQQSYVHLIYMGTIHAEERTQARDEVFDLCRQTGYHRALVDMRASNIEMSPADAVKFARSFEASRLPANYRLACVIPPGSQADKMVESLISLNGVNIKYFLSQEDALYWLTAY